MWYEILPTFGLVYAFITIPSFTAWGLNKVFNNGHHSARYWENCQADFDIYLRDRRLTGSEYVPRGLEAIPDPK